MRHDEQQIEYLVTDWISARVSIICERSGDIERDVVALLDEAKVRCEQVGVVYGVRLIPSHVKDMLDTWNDQL